MADFDDDEVVLSKQKSLLSYRLKNNSYRSKSSPGNRKSLNDRASRIASRLSSRLSSTRDDNKENTIDPTIFYASMDHEAEVL